jgi:DNA-binding NarL/FixJ family response regulator
MARVRVLVVDDSPEFVEQAIMLLSELPFVQVVGSASSGREALQFVKREQVDLMLLDLQMPDANGLDIMRQVKALPDPPKVLIVTLYDTFEFRSAARQAAADGFIAKTDFVTELRPSIEALFGGDLETER